MLIELRGVDKTYEVGGRPYHALQQVDLELPAGELVYVVGRSGSGKSTLLNMIAGLDRPSTGTVTVAGRRLDELGEDELARFRGEHVGVVFQFFQLLPTMTAAENLMLAMDLVGKVPAGRRRERALELLDGMSILEHADKLPAELSGGEQQRVAIARAQANAPQLIVADEPTGNLDSDTAAQVMQSFARLVVEGATVVLVTHDDEPVVDPDRRLTIADGRLV